MDDIIEAVQDEKVMEILSARLYTRLAPLVKDLFSEFRSEFKSEFSAQLESMVDKSTTDAVARVSEPLLQKISVLEQENKLLKLRLDELENYSRSDNLIIHGQFRFHQCR